MESFNEEANGYGDSVGILNARYARAAVELDEFLEIARLVPDGVYSPADAKAVFVSSVDVFRETAAVTTSAEDETVPAVVSDTLPLDALSLHDQTGAVQVYDLSRRKSTSAAADDVRKLAAKWEQETARYEKAASEIDAVVGEIDAAYDGVLVPLDRMMVAASRWGSADAFAKDTPEQAAALVAASAALSETEGFGSIEERASALRAFAGAYSAAKAGHEKTVADEKEAARRAAEEAARREAEQAAQRRQKSSNPPPAGSQQNSSGPQGSSPGSSAPANPGGMGAPRNYGDCGCLQNKNVWE